MGGPSASLHVIQEAPPPSQSRFNLSHPLIKSVSTTMIFFRHHYEIFFILDLSSQHKNLGFILLPLWQPDTSLCGTCVTFYLAEFF